MVNLHKNLHKFIKIKDETRHCFCLLQNCFLVNNKGIYIYFVFEFNVDIKKIACRVHARKDLLKHVKTVKIIGVCQ